jgi:hypothetical protein
VFTLRFIVIVLVPARASRLNTMSMPSEGKPGWARRNRPASARGLLGQRTPVSPPGIAAIFQAITKKFGRCAGPTLLVGEYLMDPTRDRMAIDDALDGSARAAFALGTTFDPLALKKVGAPAFFDNGMNRPRN